MDLATKRKVFFIASAIMFFILFGLAVFHPILRWADTCGIFVAGIPMPQFLIWVSAFGMGILITVICYVDTKVLVEKDDK